MPLRVDTGYLPNEPTGRQAKDWRPSSCLLLAARSGAAPSRTGTIARTPPSGPRGGEMQPGRGRFSARLFPGEISLSRLETGGKFPVLPATKSLFQWEPRAATGGLQSDRPMTLQWFSDRARIGRWKNSLLAGNSEKGLCRCAPAFRARSSLFQADVADQRRRRPLGSAPAMGDLRRRRVGCPEAADGAARLGRFEALWEIMIRHGRPREGAAPAIGCNATR